MALNSGLTVDPQGYLVKAMRAVIAAASELAKCADIDSMYRLAVDVALYRLGVERCAIFWLDDGEFRGTYGTNARREIVDERRQRFPLNDEWLSRLNALSPDGPPWALVEEPQYEWDGERSIRVGTGWIAITPIYLGKTLGGVVVNDAAIRGTPPDPIVQEAVAVFASMLGNVIENKRAELALSHERNLLRTVIDSLPDYIYIKDAESRLLLNNAAHARIAGLDRPDDVIGKTDFDLFPPDMAAQYYADDQAIITSGTSLINREEVGPGPDGQRAWSLTTKVPLRDQNGVVIGLVGMTRDISQLKEARAALERSNDELESRVQTRVAELARANAALQAAMEERLRIESALAHERNLLRTLIDHLPDQIFVKDKDSRFVLANKMCADVIGVASIDELIGKTDRDFYPAQSAEPFLADEREIVASGRPLIDREELNVNGQGVERWFATTKIPVRNEQDRVVGLVGISTDITERKQRELQLRHSEERFAKAFNASPLAIAINALDTGIFLDVNSRFLDLVGYARAELIGCPADQLPLLATMTDFDRLEALLRENSRVRSFETELVTKIGDHRDVLLAMELIEVDGTPCALVMAEDVTERKRAEKALVDERTMLRTLIDALPDYIFVKDKSGRFIASNIAHAQAAGVDDPERFIGRTAADFFPKALADRYDADDRDVLETAMPIISAERTTLARDGREIYVSTTKVPLKDETGRVVGLVGISRDVTENRRTELVLRESEQRYRTLFELSPDGILVAQDGKIVYVNAAAVTMFRADQPQDLIDRSLPDLMDGDTTALSAWLEAATGKVSPAPLTAKIAMCDDLPLDVEIIAAPVTFGSQTGLQVIIRDISERIQAEASQRESERLRGALEKERELRELKSKLMVTISHEFRTPMTIAQSSADLLVDYFDRMAPEKRREHLDRIISQIHKLIEMMEDINFIVQASFDDLTLKIEPIDLAVLCDSLVGELQASTDVHHRFVVEADRQLPALQLDMRRIKYVVTNLLSNAMKYSPHGSTIRLDLYGEVDEVVLRVTDQGIGISANDRQRLFEPFYRGQNVGVVRGTGIGLSIVKEIIDMHSGTIGIESELGRGTSVTIMLPMSESIDERSIDQRHVE